MIRILAIFFLVCCISCTKDPATFNLVNLNNNQISCFGHAGMGSRSIYPQNTMPSFESCLDRGADGTEMDVQITKDSVLVLYHDEFLDSGASCNGTIKDLNWSEISDCKMRSNLFKNLELLSFDEFIKNIPDPHRYIFTFDCKTKQEEDDGGVYYRLFARTIVRTLHQYNLTQHVYIEHPYETFLNNIRELENNARLFILTDEFEAGFGSCKTQNYYGISIHNAKITASQVKQAHDSNIHVTIYGVQTEKENYSAVEKCPDFMQTDDINYLLKIFGKYKKGKGLWYSVTK
ncbi:MAG: glycerophosphodiester phosphodiesterase family protein [Bacteroidota bacterium]